MWQKCPIEIIECSYRFLLLPVSFLKPKNIQFGPDGSWGLKLIVHSVILSELKLSFQHVYVIQWQLQWQLHVFFRKSERQSRIRRKFRRQFGTGKARDPQPTRKFRLGNQIRIDQQCRHNRKNRLDRKLFESKQRIWNEFRIDTKFRPYLQFRVDKKCRFLSLRKFRFDKK